MLRPVTGLALVASLVAPILGGCGGGAAPLTFDLMALPVPAAMSKARISEMSW
ncbi:hypothetical protein [Methylobacterium sp. WL116]|uniref:hypothetical protein n=1 Tax=Methylobacterium sp. WL116 TaxID=2603889 RepID=UPI001FEFAADC|nr:hypothetical protein [Methylobacterium sp. WL116]